MKYGRNSKSKSFDEPSESENKVHSPQVLAEIDMYTATLETEFGLEFLRQQAMESDDQVQDAAGALLNVISASDTTARSARIATETSLLSSSNAQVKCLKSLVKLERDSIKERLDEKMDNWLWCKLQLISFWAVNSVVKYCKTPGKTTANS